MIAERMLRRIDRRSIDDIERNDMELFSRLSCKRIQTLGGRVTRPPR